MIILIKVKNNKLVKQNIDGILEKEIKYEKENYLSEPEVMDIIHKNGFEIEDLPENVMVKFKKCQNDYSVITKFYYRQAPMETDEVSAEVEDNENSFDFNIYLVKNNKALLYVCSQINGEYSVDSLWNVDDFESFDKMQNFQRELQNYQGPNLDTIDEVQNRFYQNLNKNLQDFLQQFGFDQELVDSMERYAQDKEQRLYMDWMEKLSSFIKS